MVATASTRRGRLTRREWGRVAAMGAAVALLHIVGFGVLILFVVPANYQLGTGLFGLGTGLTAYTLGLRHAFDADHIAATRPHSRLVNRPRRVGAVATIVCSLM